jgi:hypothetical protein
VGLGVGGRTGTDGRGRGAKERYIPARTGQAWVPRVEVVLVGRSGNWGVEGWKRQRARVWDGTCVRMDHHHLHLLQCPFWFEFVAFWAILADGHTHARTHTHRARGTLAVETGSTSGDLAIENNILHFLHLCPAKMSRHSSSSSDRKCKSNALPAKQCEPAAGHGLRGQQHSTGQAARCSWVQVALVPAPRGRVRMRDDGQRSMGQRWMDGWMWMGGRAEQGRGNGRKEKLAPPAKAGVMLRGPQRSGRFTLHLVVRGRQTESEEKQRQKSEWETSCHRIANR